MLRIRTFGGCHVERDGTRLDGVSGQRKSLAFLAVLAGSGARGMTREAMTALLWPESDEERGRSSLKQLVHSLRGQLGQELLTPTSELRLNPDSVTSDVGEFRDALRRADHEAAARAYLGPFLDGLRVRGADGFERWASEERTVLARDFARAAESLARSAEQRGDMRAALEWWRRLADDDRLSVEATLGLMRALEAVGERVAALRQARIFELLVREELGREPDASVTELADRLRTAPASSPAPQLADRDPPPGAAPRSQAAHPALAVLPFVNTSGDPADEHFSDGLTDELIGTIGRMTGLLVTGRTSAFAFKGQRLDVRAVAESLHVESVLEGSVRRSGDRLRISAQLIRAENGAVVWSELYDGDTGDIFAVQAQIARAIARALRVTLGPASPIPERAATADPAAHELYLKGRYFQNRVSAGDLRRAVGYFEEAVARDPDYARAHAGIADAQMLLVVLGDSPAADRVARAHAAVARALALDGALAEAHASLASLLFAFDWDWVTAGREFARAAALDPAYGVAHQRYGLYLMYQGRNEEAEAVLEQARTIDPLAPSASMNLGRVHLAAGRPDAAIALLQAAIELNPHLALAHEQLGHAHLALGRHDSALAAFRRVAELDGARGATRLAYALAATGRRGEARGIVDELLAAAPRQRVPPVGMAMACAALGDVDAAFRWLDRAHDDRDAVLHTIRATPGFEGLHADPRWGALLRRIGLPAA